MLMPVPALACNYHRRKIHRRAFRSAFVRPPQIAPFKYMLNTKEYIATLGISLRTARLWRAQWKDTGYGPGARPVILDGVYRYYWEEVTQSPDGAFLARMKSDLAGFLAETHNSGNNIPVGAA
jgi:hypothetical protein